MHSRNRVWIEQSYLKDRTIEIVNAINDRLRNPVDYTRVAAQA